MLKALKISLVVCILFTLYYHFSPLSVKDEDLLMGGDTIPYVPNRIDSTGVFVPRDTTPYQGNWIDIN